MPRVNCGARGDTVDPATRWRGALVEANARRRLAQQRDRRHRPKQPAGLEEGLWISPALAGRDTDVPLEGAHGQEPGGAHGWRACHRGIHPLGRSQSHDLAGTPSVRPYRVNSWGKGKSQLDSIYATTPLSVGKRKYKNAPKEARSGARTH